MFNRILIIMWALLFVSQTMATAFDTHSIHQESNTKQQLSHRSLDVSHKLHPEGSLITSSDEASAVSHDGQDKFDCHHCCHCHAPSGVYILCTEESSALYKSNNSVMAGKTALFSFLLASDHRPAVS